MTLRELLRDWQDVDGALFLIGVSLGFWPNTHETFTIEVKGVVNSNNEVCRWLFDLLEQLVSWKLVEQDEDGRYRWVPSAPITWKGPAEPEWKFGDPEIIASCFSSKTFWRCYARKGKIRVQGEGNNAEEALRDAQRKASKIEYMSGIKYVVCPGWVTSKADYQRHYITAGQLMRLYRVPPGECIIVRDERKLSSLYKDLPRLRPRCDGNYKACLSG